MKQIDSESMAYYRKAIENAFIAFLMIRNFPRFLANRLGILKEKETVYRFWNGMKMKMRNRTTDFLILREVLGSGDYFRRGFEINPGDSVVEVGGHIGFFTVLAARRAVPGKVYVFEPSPENHRLLQENIRLNGLTNVVLSNNAVTSSSGVRSLHVDQGNTGGHSLYVEADDGNAVQVATVNLLEALRAQGVSSVDYLKMDCEGAEWEILGGMDSDDMNMFRRIAMEVHIVGDQGWDEMEKLLRERGYEIEHKDLAQDYTNAGRQSAVRMTGKILYARRSQLVRMQ